MSRACIICVHQQRAQIEQAIATREARTSIARRFGISDDTLDRHLKSGHMQRKIMAAAERVLKREAESLVEELQKLLSIARQVLSRAVQASQYGLP